MDKSLVDTVSPDKWSADGGLPGLVIWALFLMLAIMIWVIEKKLTGLAIGQEQIKADLGEKLERVRSNIIERLYDTGLLNDRRMFDSDTSVKRRREDSRNDNQ